MCTCVPSSHCSFFSIFHDFVSLGFIMEIFFDPNLLIPPLTVSTDFKNCLQKILETYDNVMFFQRASAFAIARLLGSPGFPEPLWTRVFWDKRGFPQDYPSLLCMLWTKVHEIVKCVAEPLRWACICNKKLPPQNEGCSNTGLPSQDLHPASLSGQQLYVLNRLFKQIFFFPNVLVVLQWRVQSKLFVLPFPESETEELSQLFLMKFS